MKKYLLIGCSLFIFGCNDGDLQIETVDFDSITQVQNCDVLSTTAVNVLFKINGNEALILTLPSGLLKNEVSVGEVESAVPASSKVSYRIFSDKVTKAYFCDSPPPLTPTVKEEVEAQGGSVFITTTSEDDITFTHTIKLSGISFVNEDGSRITDLQVSDFGVVTTKI